MAISAEELNPILKAALDTVEQVSAKAAASVKKQEKITKEMGATTEVAKASIAEQTEAVQVIDLHKQIADLQAQNKTIEIVESSNTINALSILQRDLVETSLEAKTANDKLEFLAEQPADGVVGYFQREFEKAGVEAELEAAESRQQTLSTSISNISASTESVQRAVATTKKSRNVDTIASGQKLIQAKGDEALAKTELESLARNSKQINAGMQADARELTFRMEAYKLHNTVENQKARAKEHDLGVKKMELQIDQYKAGAAKRDVELALAEQRLTENTDPTRAAALQATYEATVKKHADQIAFEAAAIPAVKKAQAILGIAVEDDAVVRRNLKITGKAGDRYRKLATVGASEDPVFGTTPASAAKNYSEIATENTPITPPVKLLNQIHTLQMEQYSKPGASVPKKQAQISSDFNAIAKELTDSWASNIKEGDSTNPYQAPPIPVLAEYEAVKSSKLYSVVLAPMDMKELSPKKIYEAAISGVKAKTISLEEAALGIESLFDAAAEHNNGAWNFTRVGLPNQESYITEIIEPPMFSPGAKGAAVGGLLAIGTLATLPVSAPALAVGTVVGGTAIAGTQLGGMFDQAFPLTDSMDRTQVLRALNQLMIEEASIGSFFK